MLSEARSSLLRGDVVVALVHRGLDYLLGVRVCSHECELRVLRRGDWRFGGIVLDLVLFLEDVFERHSDAEKPADGSLRSVGEGQWWRGGQWSTDFEKATILSAIAERSRLKHLAPLWKAQLEEGTASCSG